ncbi:MAG: LptF/LptG family permease [bacterium]
MKILDRMIIKEFIPNFISSLVILVFVLILNRIFELINMIVAKHVEVMIVVKLFLYNLPFIVFLTIPMAVLVASIITFGRLSSDFEITAMRSAGINVVRNVFFLFGFSALLFGVAFFFADVVVPQSNHNVRNILSQIVKMRPAVSIEEKVMKWSYDNKTRFYFEEIYEDNTFSNCRVFQENAAISCNKGKIIAGENEHEVFIKMNDGMMLENESGGEFRTTDFKELILKLKMSETIEEKSRNERGDREMNIAMLIANIKAIEASYEGKNARDQQERKKRSVYRNLTEIHKKFSISFGVFAFVLLGSIIGISLKKSSLALGFTISTVLFVIYYMMLVLGEQMADKGAANPAVSIWFPNYITLLVCAILIYRLMNRVEPISFDFLERFRRGK